MNRGYTKRWRKRWDKGYHTDPVLWLVMDYFIDFANYKDSEVYFPGSGMIKVKRGQHIFGSLKVSEFLNVHRSSVVRKIKLLETIGFMTVQANNKYSIATIINYDTYQPLQDDIEQQTEQRPNSARTAPEQRPNTPNKVNKDNKEKNTYTSEFEKFWNEYPKKIGKGAAYNSWLKIKPNNGTFELIINAVAKQRGCSQWQRDGGQYIPNPSTWLNQRRWEDQVDCVLEPVKTKRQLQIERAMKL